MPSYFLGVDIGGTKSHALLADQTGKALGFGFYGPGNHEVVGYAGLQTALQAVTEQALSSAGITTAQVTAAGFGVAGYDWPRERQPTLEAIQTLGITTPLEAVNDTIVGLLAGAEQGWGVAVVAGTGTNCWGWDQDHQTGRITGVGYGEYGGAGSLVFRALEAISHEWTLRGPKTMLTQEFLQQTGVNDIPSLFEAIELGECSVGAEFAPIVHKVAVQGDPVALSIIEWAGSELGHSAVAVIRQLGIAALEFEVVLVGSIYAMGEMVVQPMRQVIQSEAPLARLVHLSAPPVVGGVILAMQLAGVEPSTIRQQLVQSTCNLMAKAAHPCKPSS